MSRVSTLSIEFESELAKARQQYEDFVREVESKVVRIPVEFLFPSGFSPGPGFTGGGPTGGGPPRGAGPGPISPGGQTFSGGSGQVGGGPIIVPPPIVPVTSPFQVTQPIIIPPGSPWAPEPKRWQQQFGSTPPQYLPPADYMPPPPKAPSQTNFLPFAGNYYKVTEPPNEASPPRSDLSAQLLRKGRRQNQGGGLYQTEYMFKLARDDQQIGYLLGTHDEYGGQENFDVSWLGKTPDSNDYDYENRPQEGRLDLGPRAIRSLIRQVRRILPPSISSMSYGRFGSTGGYVGREVQYGVDHPMVREDPSPPRQPDFFIRPTQKVSFGRGPSGGFGQAFGIYSAETRRRELDVYAAYHREGNIVEIDELMPHDPEERNEVVTGDWINDNWRTRNMLGVRGMRRLIRQLSGYFPQGASLSYSRGGSTGGEYGRDVLFSNEALQRSLGRSEPSPPRRSPASLTVSNAYAPKQNYGPLRISLDQEYLSGGPGGDAVRDFLITPMKDLGNVIGEMTAIMTGERAHVGSLKAYEGRGAIGVTELLRLKRQLMEMYPEIKEVAYTRAGSTGGKFSRNVNLGLPDPAVPFGGRQAFDPSESEYENIKSILGTGIFKDVENQITSSSKGMQTTGAIVEALNKLQDRFPRAFEVLQNNPMRSLVLADEELIAFQHPRLKGGFAAGLYHPAGANRPEAYISIPQQDPQRSILHELMHHVQYSRPDLYEQAMAYLPEDPMQRRKYLNNYPNDYFDIAKEFFPEIVAKTVLSEPGRGPEHIIGPLQNIFGPQNANTAAFAMNYQQKLMGLPPVQPDYWRYIQFGPPGLEDTFRGVGTGNLADIRGRGSFYSRQPDPERYISSDPDRRTAYAFEVPREYAQELQALKPGGIVGSNFIGSVGPENSQYLRNFYDALQRRTDQLNEEISITSQNRGKQLRDPSTGRFISAGGGAEPPQPPLRDFNTGRFLSQFPLAPTYSVGTGIIPYGYGGGSRELMRLRQTYQGEFAGEYDTTTREATGRAVDFTAYVRRGPTTYRRPGPYTGQRALPTNEPGAPGSTRPQQGSPLARDDPAGATGWASVLHPSLFNATAEDWAEMGEPPGSSGGGYGGNFGGRGGSGGYGGGFGDEEAREAMYRYRRAGLFDEEGAGGAGGAGGRRFAFGFIRPLAAGYIFARGVHDLGDRILRERAEGRSIAASNLFGTLAEQVTASTNVTDSQEGRFSVLVGDALRQVPRFRAVVGGIFDFFRGTKWGQSATEFTDSYTFDINQQLKQDAVVLQLQNEGVELHKQRMAQQGLVGSSGLGEELQSSREGLRQGLYDLYNLGPVARVAGAIGEQQKRANDLIQLNKKQEQDIFDRAQQQGDQLRQQFVSSTFRSSGQFYAAGLNDIYASNQQETFETERDLKGLPSYIASMIRLPIQDLQAQRIREYQATYTRQTGAQILGLDYQSRSREQGNAGNFLGSAVSSIYGQFQPIIQLLDLSGPLGAKLKGSFERLQGAALQGAIQTEAARVLSVEGATYGAQVQYATRNQTSAAIIAARTAERAALAQIGGIAPAAGSTPAEIAAHNREVARIQQGTNAQVGLIEQQRSDYLTRANAALSSESRGLALGLAHLPTGQAIEALAGGYEDRALGLVNEPELQAKTYGNEAQALRLFKQNYLESFTGSGKDLRLFMPSYNQVEDPSTVLGIINDRINESLDKQLESVADAAMHASNIASIPFGPSTTPDPSQDPVVQAVRDLITTMESLVSN